LKRSVQLSKTILWHRIILESIERSFPIFCFNPWNHRADISAKVYLKPFKKGKKFYRIVSSEYFIKNFAVIPKKKHFFGYLVRVDFLRFFAKVLLPEKLLRKCEISLFLGKFFVHAIHLTLKFNRILGQILFWKWNFNLEVKFKRVVYKQLAKVKRDNSFQYLKQAHNVSIRTFSVTF
jgi:hypothetical protein